MSLSQKRLEMGRAIVRFEGRYKDGKLQVYKLPPGDGGGEFEIAGINQRYHPATAQKLKGLIEEGLYTQAEEMAAHYIEQYTRPVVKFFPSPEIAEQCLGIEFVLRDTAFNRGLKGAATVLQHALGMQQIDGLVGPSTKKEFAHQLKELGMKELLRRISEARETYERNTYPWKTGKRDEKSKFWAGLSKRWKGAHEVALERFA